jgi:hypothetical protein
MKKSSRISSNVHLMSNARPRVEVELLMARQAGEIGGGHGISVTTRRCGLVLARCSIARCRFAASFRACCESETEMALEFVVTKIHTRNVSPLTLCITGVNKKKFGIAAKGDPKLIPDASSEVSAPHDLVPITRLSPYQKLVLRSYALRTAMEGVSPWPVEVRRLVGVCPPAQGFVRSQRTIIFKEFGCKRKIPQLTVRVEEWRTALLKSRQCNVPRERTGL